VSTENTYKYHMQVQEKVTPAAESSLQQTHTGPLKQLLKPTTRTRPTTSTSECSVSNDSHTDHDQTETQADQGNMQPTEMTTGDEMTTEMTTGDG